jgi:glycosyltransferase involved in cell wall biosynthesis
MAVRDGERYVREALDSVLAQSVSDFEFVIVDDASTDDTPAILDAYRRRDRRIRVMRNERCLGPYPSANRGLQTARGDIIARHDADDVSPPDRFAIQLEMFRRGAPVLVAGAVEMFRDSKRAPRMIRPPDWQPRLEWELLFTNVIGAGGHVMFPRIIEGLPVRFPCRTRYAEDYRLWSRLARLGPVVCPGDVVYRYREHDDSISVRARAEQDACFREICRSHQSEYLAAPISPVDSGRVSRFWRMEGRGRMDGPLECVDAILSGLACGFLAYVTHRYGPAERMALASEIADATTERLGHWLYRSIRHVDGRVCRDVMALANRRHQLRPVAGDVLRRLATFARAMV